MLRSYTITYPLFQLLLLLPLADLGFECAGMRK